MLPLMIAWGATGWQLWRAGDPTPAPELAATPASAD
jgi:hypothetical protein